MKVKPIPEGMNMLIPHLVVDNAKKAIAFYKKAFMAEERNCMMTPDGKRVMHACLEIGGQTLFVSDDCSGKKTTKGKAMPAVTLHLYVGDADKVFNRAIRLGAKQEMALENTFWGDRYGRLLDPCGQSWAIATHVEDVMPDEMMKRSQKVMAGV